MKIYNKPRIEIINFENEDVITASAIYTNEVQKLIDKGVAVGKVDYSDIRYMEFYD
ncbi:MAG: hypothetical protein IJT23_05115 [Clostridia bacterium]|nr:hypothetical protein [Clostridia bacterium]